MMWRDAMVRLRLHLGGAAPRLLRLPLLGPVLRRAGNRLVPRGATLWKRIQSGEARCCWILVDVRSEAGLQSGKREPAVQEVLRRGLGSGKVFYDIGANTGFFSLLASKLVGADGRIFAFEAEPDAAERLRRVVERNQLGNITVVEKAVWSKSGVLSFDRGLGSPDRFVGHVAEGSGAPGCIHVSAVALDDFVRSAPPPDVVKCDVEGGEVEVFRGAARLLRERQPVVVCEVHSPEILGEIELLFHRVGFELTFLESERAFPTHILAVGR